MLSPKEIIALIIASKRLGSPVYKTPKVLIKHIANINAAPEATEFLDFVIEANWKEVQSMLDKNPLLMFEYAETMDIDNTVIRMNGVKFATYVTDIRCIHIFEQTAKKHGFQKQYLEEVKVQTSRFNMAPIYEAYQNNINAWEAYENKTISKEKLFEASQCLARAQLASLPRHRLIELCLRIEDHYQYGNIYWGVDAQFKDDTIIEGCLSEKIKASFSYFHPEGSRSISIRDYIEAYKNNILPAPVAIIRGEEFISSCRNICTPTTDYYMVTNRKTKTQEDVKVMKHVCAIQESWCAEKIKNFESDYNNKIYSENQNFSF